VAKTSTASARHTVSLVPAPIMVGLRTAGIPVSTLHDWERLSLKSFDQRPERSAARD